MNSIDKFKEIVGENNISINPDDLKTYASDASQIEGVVQAVVWPQNVEQARDIFRLANMRDFGITIRGAGTSLDAPSVPMDTIVIDTNKMCKIIALHREDHFVIVEPGVTLKRLNEALKNYNLFFPIIPNSGKVCTIGGMVANNSHGIYSHRFGRMSDWVQELEIVDGSGKVLIVKDMNRMLGSEGNFALITAIKLKLIPPFNEISSNLFTFKNAMEVFEKIKELEKDESVISIQYMDKNCSKLLNLHQDEEEETETHLLIVEYDNAKAEPGARQEIRDALFKELHKAKLHYIKQILVPKEKIDTFLKYTRKNRIHTFGSITRGIFQLYFNNVQKKELNEIMQQIKTMECTVLNIGTFNKQFMTEEKIKEHEKLKKLYDPLNILNRGKQI